MNFRHPLRALSAAACATLITIASPARAEDDDLPSLVNKAILAMKQEKWKEALALNTQAVERYSKNALVLFGPRFGMIHYRKGLCEMKLKEWGAAMTSFEACYKDFPNAGNAGAGNNFEKMALLKWGESAMGAEDWKKAIELFQKFLKERDKVRDKYPEGAFHVSMAICYYNLGRLPEGNEQLEIAIKNKERFPTPDSAIVAGFQALVTGALAKNDEKALVDFIQKNRGELVIEPYAMQQYSRVFMKLAGDSVTAGMERAAIALYQFVPSTDAAIEDIRARLKSVADLRHLRDGSNIINKSMLEAALKALEEEQKGGKSMEMVKLSAIAFLNEKNGNIRGAYNAYLQLEKFYPQAAKREDNLFNLVRTSSRVAPGPETQSYGEVFLKNFPDSKHAPLVRRLMLSSLFSEGEYETCIEVAEPMIEKLEPGTVEHDICLHVLGGSYFYTGQFDKAQPLLDQHVEKYPDSMFKIAATYFRAANLSRLQFWKKAAGQLDEFLEKYPDASSNVFIPFALYDRATCHYAEEEYDEALTAIARIIDEFPECNVTDQAYNLRGNVEQALGNNDNAEQAYIKALEIAETRRNAAIASESLFSLVALLGQNTPGKEPNPRIKDAVPYADRFWKEYSEGSPLQSRVAVAQLHAFVAAGRADEALERLQNVIAELAKDPEATGLEELVNSYTEAYLTNHTAEQLKEHYYNFPKVRATDHAARALLRVAVIGVFEEIVKKSDDEAVKSSGTARIKVLFQELKTDFALKDLTNFILVKIGDYLRANTSTPREALPYYDEALNRPDQSYRFAALLGRADVYGKSENAADLDKAIEDFTRVYTDSQDKPQREFALYRMIETLMAKKDYAKAETQARAYLDTKTTGFSKYSPKVWFMLAQSFDLRNMPEDAMAVYVQIWAGAHKGNIQVAAPSIKRWMELSWERNKPSKDTQTPADRQGAYEGGAKWIELTSRFKDKMTEADLELWKEVEALVKTYEANPGIKSMATIKREKEAAKNKR